MNFSRKRIRSATIAAAVVLGFVVPTVAASAAYASVYNCGSGRICTWASGSFSGSPLYTTPILKVPLYPSSYNNQATSLANNTLGRVWFYDGASYVGASVSRDAGGVAEDLVWLGMNDKISSHYS